MNRRTLLAGGALTVLAAGSLTWYGSRTWSTDAAALRNRPRLSHPPVLDATETLQFELVAQYGQLALKGIGASSTAGFNQSYLGPTILIRNGQVSGNVVNRLNEDVTVHWHGLLIPGDQDGGPHQPISPDGKWSPQLNVDQPPATLWYHSHSHQRTAVQVYHGLAGLMHLTDGLDRQRGLPADYGIDDLSLVIQDRCFDEKGGFSYSTSMMDIMHGNTGDTILVNGQVGAVATVPKGIVRLRLLNGSNARIYNLFVDDGRPMHLIATDSGFLAKAVSVDRLTLSPGERAEVLVDFSNGDPITIFSDADPNQGPGGMMGRFRQVIARYTRKSFPVLSLAVDDQIPARITRLPDDLGGETPSFAETVRNVRTFELNMGMGMMGGRQTNAPLFAINDRAFNLKRLDFNVPLGTSETWTIRSQMLSHPFHVHGTRFQVLSENGGPPRPEYNGWKDTVLVDGSVELKMRFDHAARPDAPFMYHCHILEHEDRGMMGQFSVV